jgi:predicted AAA+ superfamily ATPase
VGKTTLARQVERGFAGPVRRFDLEDERDRNRLADPYVALAELRGLVVLDEIQRVPDLFPALRVLADRTARPARFLILGSASPELLRQGSETLAGRIRFHELPGFDLSEVGAKDAERLWLRGGLPLSYLDGSDQASLGWRLDYVRTFVERDLPSFGVRVEPDSLRRLWSMVAHWHGQVWNASRFSRAFGVSDAAIRHWLDVLVASFAVVRLAPWHENLAKRQVKSPKVYVADSGVLHALLNIPTMDDLLGHPTLGFSWEGFAIAQVATALGARRDECYFWATHQGAELDLLVVRGRRRLGFEIKRTSAPAVSRSMRIAIDDLKLDSLDVIHAASETYPLGPRTRAIALSRVTKDVKPL